MHPAGPTPAVGQGPGQTGSMVTPAGQAVACLTCRACEHVCSHALCPDTAPQPCEHPQPLGCGRSAAGAGALCGLAPVLTLPRRHVALSLPSSRPGPGQGNLMRGLLESNAEADPALGPRKLSAGGYPVLVPTSDPLQQPRTSLACSTPTACWSHQTQCWADMRYGLHSPPALRKTPLVAGQLEANAADAHG